MQQSCNIALKLRTSAQRLPDKKAVIIPVGKLSNRSYTHVSFKELDELSDAYSRGFNNIGIKQGTRTLLAVKPGVDFFAITFALLKTGAVPVLIDPGMGRERLLECIEGVEPEALIGIPLAHMARKMFPRFFKSITIAVTVGRRLLWGGHTLKKIADPRPEPYPITIPQPEELAAILFTTGSTGPAKGVEYCHGMLAAQLAVLETTFGIREDDIDLPTFPGFALFSVGIGMSVVIPEMDPTKPAEVNPMEVIKPIQDHKCTFCFGSPALWKRVSAYCVEQKIKLPSLRRILMAGAPVPAEVHERLLSHVLSPGAETHTPYGATESMPTSDMTGSEVTRETASLTAKGKGCCVGRPVHGVSIEVIRLTDEVIEEWDNDLILPQGEIGEIVTSGPNITRAYFRNRKATALAKIKDGASVRHRMGDLGYIDEQGRLWFCGRKSHRVETGKGILYTVCCEAIFNAHPRVSRTALVGVGERPAQKPVIIIEPVNARFSKQELISFKDEILELGRAEPMTEEITTVLFHPSFPVDIRHNAKIFREKLSLWARSQLS